MTTRRSVLAGLGGALSLAACARAPGARTGDVVAAGQPAALLIWALARDRLAGWPRKPDPECLRGLPAAAAALPQLGSLVGTGRAANPETIAALKPSLILDYGDVDRRNQALGAREETRLGAEWRLIDGALTHIPQALHEAGALLGAPHEGDNLAQESTNVLERWRGAPAGPSFYYARGADGLETGFRGALATEVLEGAGWTNVAEGSRDIGRVDREQVVAWDPETLVTLNPVFARAARQDGVWRFRRNGSIRRILLVPDKPFGWVDRPPSVNRLLGCAWLARPEDTLTLTMLSRRLYGMAPVEIARPEWI